MEAIPPMTAAVPAPPAPKTLAVATLAALAVAAVVLVTAVLPAEYGIDPTGIGRAAGFSRLSGDAGVDAPVVEPVEQGPRPLYALAARWEVVEVPVATQDGFTEGDFHTTRVALPLNLMNVTKVTARLDWWDNDTVGGRPTEPDLFELSIDGPDGRGSPLVQAENVPGGHGNVTASLAWRSAPLPERNGTAGRLVLPLLPPDSSAQGDWTFVVRLYEARGLANATERDPGNAWRLTVTAETYELVVEEQDALVGDRVRLTLRPGEGLEYKFHLEPGATLRYAWEATAPVYWDLHAEEDGRDPDDFTRFAEGTGDSDRGNVTASFPGRHGWFWRNDGAVAATVTLETRGDYTIVGVP